MNRRLHSDILKLPLEVRALMALKAAVRKAIREHHRDGIPVYVLKDGKVAILPPPRRGKPRKH